MVGRTRPDPGVVQRTVPDIQAASFPSGHAMGAVMLYGMTFFIATRIHNRAVRLAVQIPSALLIPLVGFARVWEGAHWPTDVLGAYAFGGLFLVALIAAYTRVEAAAGHLPFIHAGKVAHDESLRHAHALAVEPSGERYAVVSEFVAGTAPRDKAAAKSFLHALRKRFEQAGLPTWQINPRQPRAVDNLLETADGRYMVVDLESGLVTTVASPRTWRQALRPRRWKPRAEAAMSHSQEKAMTWLDGSIVAWQREGRITAEASAGLRAQMETPRFQAVVPHLGVHVAISVALRFPRSARYGLIRLDAESRQVGGLGPSSTSAPVACASRSCRMRCWVASSAWPGCWPGRPSRWAACWAAR